MLSQCLANTKCPINVSYFLFVPLSNSKRSINEPTFPYKLTESVVFLYKVNEEKVTLS